MPHLFRHSNTAHMMSNRDYNHSLPSQFLPLENTSPTYLRPGGRPAPVGKKQTRSQGHYYGYDEHAGSEPGVDPRSGESIAEYSHLKQDCDIEVVDYDCEDATFQKLTNDSFISFLRGNTPGVQLEEAGPPRVVRWINIVGIDWSVLSAIALKYNLHSLALEDILHERGHTHTKTDYYPGHLFLRVLCHSLDLGQTGNRNCSSSSEKTSAKRSNESAADLSPELSAPELKRQRDLEEGGIPVLSKVRSRTGSENTIAAAKSTAASSVTPPHSYNSLGKGKGKAADETFTGNVWASSLQKRFTSLSGFGGPAREKKKMQIRAITEGDRVSVNLEPMFIFLLRDGTVISIRSTRGLDYTSPIAERLHRADSVLRTSEDASLLVQSLLDLIVDRVLEVVDEYQVKIDKLEHDILLHPIMKTVRSLHILSGDLTLHKRTLEPVRTMVYGLRRYDLERCRALADDIAVERDDISDTDAEKVGVNGEKTADKANGKPAKIKKRRCTGEEDLPGGHRHSIDHRQQRKVVGYFSYKAKVYLADVNDHMDFAITSLDMFAGISENLINYAFNIASYEMNIVMNRLTTATIIFLPLTLLTGYFGMNFTPMWSVQQNSDVFFWKIAIPVMVVLIPIFMYNDIRKAIHFLRRRGESRRAGARY